MEIVYGDKVAAALLEALGIPWERVREVTIRLRPMEPVIIEIVNIGDKRLEDFDWSQVKSANVEVNVVNQVYDYNDPKYQKKVGQ